MTPTGFLKGNLLNLHFGTIGGFVSKDTASVGK